jgi:hypothetical protein
MRHKTSWPSFEQDIQDITPWDSQQVGDHDSWLVLYNVKLFRTSGKFSDIQMAVLHGQVPSVYKDQLKPIKEKRANMIAAAVKTAEGLGHKLFKNWTPLNSNRCRKCGMSVSLPNVLCHTSAPDSIGAAVTSKCNVTLTFMPDNHFELSDMILDEGTALNKTPDTTII